MCRIIQTPYKITNIRALSRLNRSLADAVQHIEEHVPKSWPPPTPPDAVFPGGLYDAIAFVERASLAQYRAKQRERENSRWPNGLGIFLFGLTLLLVRKYTGWW